MKNYIELWYRGWWTWLMVLCLNLAIGVVTIPVFLLIRGLSASWVWPVSILIWLVIGAPAWGWIFEIFARKTTRIDWSKSN